MKPCISASSYKTRVTSADTADADTTLLNGWLIHHDFLIQEFVEEIDTQGEMSLIFFDRNFSHAVLKKARPGDFRVQESFGGVTTACIPSHRIVKAAASILDQIPGEVLYARIDGVERNGEFCLMEAELIEPALFLKYNSTAGGMFADAIEHFVRRTKSIR